MNPAVAEGVAHFSGHAPGLIRALMVSTSYPANLLDWRGLFIRHLCFALARRKQLQLEFWAPPGDIPEGVTHLATAEERRWLESLVDAGGIAQLLRARGALGIRYALQLLRHLRTVYTRSTADLYHINWLQNALAVPDDGRPILVSALGTDLQLLKVPGIRLLLKRVFGSRRTVICPNSEWMVEPLASAFGSVAEVRFVPFGIASAWFDLKREVAYDRPVWLCVSRLTRGKLGTLFEWGRRPFTHGGRELHLLGPMQDEIQIPDWVTYHGPQGPDSLLTHWFPKAHGLISMSNHAEGRPQVMLEAMAAGLPVVASSIPAHRDLIQHMRTGVLCSDAEEFCSAIERLGDSRFNEAIGSRAKEAITTSTGTWDDCASRYFAIYCDLVHRR